MGSSWSCGCWPSRPGEELTGYAEREGYGRYVTATSVKGRAEIDWSIAHERRRFLQEIVADADRLLDHVRAARGHLDEGSPEDRALTEAAGLLARVLVQDIERHEDGPALKDGVARDRLSSVHDPAMRHGRKSASKRFDGHKAQLAVDTDSQLITAVAVLAGNAPDSEQALAMVEATEANTGCAVEVTMGDCAYGDGGTRQQFHDADRTLVAKVPTTTNQGRFPKTDFTLDLERGTCTCPAGHTTEDFRPAKPGGGTFRFAAVVCGAGPLRAQCVRGGGGRSVSVHPQEVLIQEARACQASPAFREYRIRRQTVEHRIARLTQLGLRQARYFGTAKTLFQVAMTAAVANLTLLMHRADPEASSTPLAALLWGLCGALGVLRNHRGAFRAPFRPFRGGAWDLPAPWFALPPCFPSASIPWPFRPNF